MPSTTSNDLITSTKWDGSNETHDGYKTWMNEVSLWANNNDMAWIIKIAKRLEDVFKKHQTSDLPFPEPHLWATSSSTKRTPLARNPHRIVTRPQSPCAAPTELENKKKERKKTTLQPW